MSDFAKAFPRMMRNEKGRNNTPFDKGGDTWDGISKKFWPVWFAKLEAAQSESERDALVKEFYKVEFWDKGRFSLLESDEAAYQLFDMMVNGGEGALKAIVIHVQSWLNHVFNHTLRLKEDGVLGPITARFIDLYPRISINHIRRCREEYYDAICQRDPTQLVFLHGWLNRI